MTCRYCDGDPRSPTICGQYQEFYKEDKWGRPLKVVGENTWQKRK